LEVSKIISILNTIITYTIARHLIGYSEFCFFHYFQNIIAQFHAQINTFLTFILQLNPSFVDHKISFIKK